MIALWMLYTTGIALVIGIAAMLLDEAARLYVVPRRFIWAASILAIVTASGLSWRASARLDSIPALRLGVQSDTRPDGARVPSATVSEAKTPTSGPRRISLEQMAVAVWMLLSSGMITVLAVSAMQLHRTRRRWPTVHIDGADVLLSDGMGPAVLGVIRPVIAIPQWALDEPEVRRRLIVAHEQEHVRAGDQRLIALSLVAAVLLPWNVGLWWAIRRLRHAIEIDCDARVTRGRDVRAYGELLIDVSHRPAKWTALTTFAESPSFLERRIAALTVATPPRARGRAGLFFAASTLLIAGACELPRPMGPGVARALEARPKELGLHDPAYPWPPGMQEIVRNVVTKDYPALATKGIARGKALWLAANSNGDILDTWIGQTFNDTAYFRARARFDSLYLNAFTPLVRIGDNAIPIVFMRETKPWEIHEEWPPWFPALVRDSIRAYLPSEYASLARGQAIYVRFEGRGVEKMWRGAASADPKVQWAEARAHYPGRQLVIATNMTVTKESGQTIPVVIVSKTAWNPMF